MFICVYICLFIFSSAPLIPFYSPSFIPYLLFFTSSCFSLSLLLSLYLALHHVIPDEISFPRLLPFSFSFSSFNSLSFLLFAFPILTYYIVHVIFFRERWSLVQEEKEILAYLEKTSNDKTQEKENEKKDQRLGEIYEQLQIMNASSSESKARRILFGLGFNKEMQIRPTKYFSGRNISVIVCDKYNE